MACSVRLKIRNRNGIQVCSAANKNFQDLALGFRVNAFIQAIEDDDVRDFVGVNTVVEYFVKRMYNQASIWASGDLAKMQLSLSITLATRRRSS
jgi:hypothetical protein